MLEWIRDDITWCGNKCDNKECFRNLENKQGNGLFSMAYLKDTKLCPLSEDYNGREAVDET